MDDNPWNQITSSLAVRKKETQFIYGFPTPVERNLQLLELLSEYYPIVGGYYATDHLSTPKKNKCNAAHLELPSRHSP